MTDIVHYDRATFMAARVQLAADIEVKPVEHVTLPGAMAALPVAKANAYLKAGLDAGQVVSRVNDQWRADNAARLEAQAEWAQGPYRRALTLMAQEKAQQAALEMQRRARFEALTQDRDGG